MPKRRTNEGEIGSALRASDVLTQITSMVGAIEELSPQGNRRRSQYLSFRVARVRYPRLLRGSAAEAVFSPPVEKAMSGAKLMSSVLLLVLHPKSRPAKAARIAQVAAHAYSHFRVAGYGQDGSDHALAVLHGAQLIAAFSKSGSASERAVFNFVAAQGLLSYFVSGTAKLISPVWRSGTALPAIMRATTYGDERVYGVMRDYPAVSKAAAWGTILGETVAPLTLLAPAPVRTAWQGSMIAMHAGIARYMGLNRFLWAFTAFHPVIAVATRQTSGIVAAMVRDRLARTGR